jgi:alkane 1-monooxygenase
MTAASTNTSPLTPGNEWRFLIAWIFPLGMIAHLLTNPQTAGIAAVIIWVAVAAFDHWAPGGQTSPVPRGHHAWHSLILRVYAVLQMFILGLAAWVIAVGGFNWPVVVGVAFGAGWIAGAQGITFAHELGHSRSKFDRFLGWVLMTSVWYPHFMVEHYRGHHPRAATFEDPASARRGENVYRFWVRSVAGSFASAWALEAKRLQQMKRGWSQSPLVWAFAVNLGVASVLVGAGLGVVLAAWLLCSVVAFSLLEVVNYIEHYGLQRQVIDGKREPFAEAHAWNANHWFTNALLANLQRHSDHHTRAWKPYAELNDSPPPAPQLPTGYAGCVLLALVPPVWFGLMHPRLDALERA